MEKEVILKLFVNTDDTLEEIEKDLMTEISCASNYYELISIETQLK